MVEMRIATAHPTKGQARVRSTARFGLLLVLSGVLTACASKRPVNYESYERIPDSPASITFRVLAKSNPITAKKAFYGNYGGPGNVGGEPQDEMDEYFRRHDIVYHLSKTRRTMLVADEELIAAINALDATSLSPHGIEYRKRATGFFGSKISHVIGKPWSTFFVYREPSGSYFHSPQVVREFFDSRHTGMPWCGRLAEQVSRTAR